MSGRIHIDHFTTGYVNPSRTHLGNLSGTHFGVERGILGYARGD
ncbi:hypothetical protein RCH12_003713, partial [Cryobacterium sp. MP_3.1]|nr:hypothetical protein [Cryobacterium sp. MP_3.1]